MASSPLRLALGALKPNLIYTLAPPKALAQAAREFSQGAVKSFRWGDSGRLLEARMNAEDEPSVRFAWGEDKLNWVCDCGRRGNCSHVLTAAMTIARVLHEAKFHANDLPAEQLEVFRRQLRAEPEVPPRGRVTFAQRDGVWEIDYDSGRREASWRVVEPPPELAWLTWQKSRPDEVATGFAAWLAKNPEVEFVIETGGETLVGERPVVRSLTARTALRVEEGCVRIHRQVLDGSEAVAGRVCDLGFGLAYLPEANAFVPVVPRDAWMALATWPGGDVRVPVSDPRLGPALAGGGSFSLLDAAGRETAAVPVTARALVEVGSGSGTVFLAVRAAADGVIPVHGLVAEAFRVLSDDGPYALLVKSPRRRHAVVAWLVRATEVPREEREAFFEMLVQDETFVSRAMHGEDAARCVRHLLEILDDLDAERLVPDAARTPNPWLTVTGAGAALARAMAAVWAAFPGIELLRSRDLVTTAAPADFSRSLRELATSCAERGVDLRVDEGAVRIGSLVVTVRAQAGEKLDWFELHPEARVGSLVLPREAWDSVLRTGRYRDAEDVVVTLDQQSLDLLRQVAELAAARECPRLRLFDWAALRAQGLVLDLPPEDDAVVRSLGALDGIPAVPLPSGLRAELREYQRHGYHWLAFLYRHRFGACLADDMGLGKTLQAIALLAASQEGVVARQSAEPHLVVLPPTLLFNWQAELARFAPALRVHEYAGGERSAEFADCDVVLTTYDVVRRDVAVLAGREFDVAIFDEAQMVKNAASARAQALAQIRARFRLCLTGTPLENHFGEFHSIMESAVPGVFGDRKKFLSDHEAGLPVLDRARPFLLRRTKERILTELPPRVESDAWFALSEIQKECYTRAVAEVRREVLEAYKNRPAQQAGIAALAALMRLRQICISPRLLGPDLPSDAPKIDHLVEQLAELESEGHAALVFSQFVKALDLVATALDAAGLRYLRIDGSTPTARRKERVEAFQSGSGPGVFLISLKVGGAGLNLTRASYVYHLDPWWNPAVEHQASGRVHRIGQQNSVFVQRFLMRHTVEEKMMTLKARKQELFRTVVEYGEAAGPAGAAALTADDFRFLLEESAAQQLEPQQD